VPQYGWIKNKSDVPQYWGPHGVEPHGVALIPITVIENLRLNPQREIVVISDDPGLWVFKATEHLPFSERYREIPAS
jgi:hypothetical protein